MGALTNIEIVLADHAMEAALHALSLRSKAHWGYDAEFMALAAPHLTLRPEWHASGRVFVARIDGRLAGVGVILSPRCRRQCRTRASVRRSAVDGARNWPGDGRACARPRKGRGGHGR
jgi:hypothetical protein